MALHAHAQAAEAIGDLTPGCEMFGFTKGQFSISDVIAHCLDQTGPATLDIGTWTAALGDLKRAENLLNDGRITRIRFVVDPSFRSRKPEFCDALVRTFGEGAIRTTNSHAKFAVIRNATWNLAIRTSMNLNPNPRLENFEISDDPAFAAFFTTIVDEIFQTYRPEESFTTQSGSHFSRLGARQEPAPSPRLPFAPAKLAF